MKKIQILLKQFRILWIIIQEKTQRDIHKKQNNSIKNIILIGLTPVNEKLTNPYENTFFFNDRIKQYNKIIENCCSKDILFIDLFEEWINNPKYINWLGDGLHPNAKGYEKMYQKIKEFLIKNKIIK